MRNILLDRALMNFGAKVSKEPFVKSARWRIGNLRIVPFETLGMVATINFSENMKIVSVLRYHIPHIPHIPHGTPNTEIEFTGHFLRASSRRFVKCPL